jgi:hypothetical protein
MLLIELSPEGERPIRIPIKEVVKELILNITDDRNITAQVSLFLTTYNGKNNKWNIDDLFLAVQFVRYVRNNQKVSTNIPS